MNSFLVFATLAVLAVGCQACDHLMKDGKLVDPYSAVGECPDKPGSSPKYLPDSEDCKVFYECDAEGFPCPLTCPDGLEFNPIKLVCDFPDVAGCKAHTTSTSTTKSTTTTTTPVPESTTTTTTENSLL